MEQGIFFIATITDINFSSDEILRQHDAFIVIATGFVRAKFEFRGCAGKWFKLQMESPLSVRFCRDSFHNLRQRSQREQVDQGNPVPVILANPTLIRRPVLVGDDLLHSGFSKADYENLFPRT